MSADAITVLDGGQAMMWTTTFIQPDDPDRILADPGMGHLGFGLLFANAAKLAHPEWPVICITGDGALGCTGQELEMALEALPEVFANALQAGKPAVIDVEVEYTPHPMDFMWPNIILHNVKDILAFVS